MWPSNLFPFLQRIQYAKQDSDLIAKMKGTYVERDRKKERTKRVKGSEGGGSKKAAQAAAGAMVAGVPSAMPVSAMPFVCCSLFLLQTGMKDF